MWRKHIGQDSTKLGTKTAISEKIPAENRRSARKKSRKVADDRGLSVRILRKVAENIARCRNVKNCSRILERLVSIFHMPIVASQGGAQNSAKSRNFSAEEKRKKKVEAEVRDSSEFLRPNPLPGLAL